MARKKEIDRDKVLDAAEAVILESGGRNFTLDAVAAPCSGGGLSTGVALGKKQATAMPA